MPSSRTLGRGSAARCWRAPCSLRPAGWRCAACRTRSGFSPSCAARSSSFAAATAGHDRGARPRRWRGGAARRRGALAQARPGTGGRGARPRRRPRPQRRGPRAGARGRARRGVRARAARRAETREAEAGGDGRPADGAAGRAAARRDGPVPLRHRQARRRARRRHRAELAGDGEPRRRGARAGAELYRRILRGAGGIRRDRGRGERPGNAHAQGRRRIRPGAAGPCRCAARGAPLPTWWRGSPREVPLLTGWAGGPAAERLKEGDRLAGALDSVARIFGRTRHEIESLVEGVRMVDWSEDPFARGAYAYELAGSPPDLLPRLAAPEEETLFFAGEATSLTGRGGTVDGALETGLRAAKQLLQTL